jgi:hypothetical protein
VIVGEEREVEAIARVAIASLGVFVVLRRVSEIGQRADYPIKLILLNTMHNKSVAIFEVEVKLNHHITKL